MSLAFQHDSGAIAIGSLPDVDPNTGGGPATARIFDLGAGRVPGGENSPDGPIANGVSYYLLFVGGAAQTADVTVWVEDATDGSWVSAQVDTGIGQRIAFEVLRIGVARVFFQITNPAGGFTTVAVRATRMTP